MKIKAIYTKTWEADYYPKSYRSTKDNIYILADARSISSFHTDFKLSQIAVDTIKDSFKKGRAYSVTKRLDMAILESGRKTQVISRDLCVSIAAIHFHKETAYIANLGKARCYRIRHGKIQQLTKDHLFSEEMDSHRQTVACSLDINMEPNISIFSVKNRDIFLLCSDRLSNSNSSEKIFNMIKKADQDNIEENHALIAVLQCFGVKRLKLFLPCLAFVLIAGSTGYWLNERSQNVSDTQEISYNYFIQIGFFKYKDNADKVIDEIKTKKPEYKNMLYLSEEFYSDKNGYYGRSVRIGPFYNEAQANTALQEIKAIGYKNSFYRKET